jgi:hypothetical protein
MAHNANLGTDVRRQHMPAHLSFLEKNAARIKGLDRCERRRAIPPADYGLSKQRAQTSSSAGERRPILANRIAALGPHSELGPGLRRRQADDLTPVRQGLASAARNQTGASGNHVALKAIAASAASAMAMRVPGGRSEAASWLGTRNNTRPDSACGTST